MTPVTPGVKLTYDDFLLFPDDGMRHELIGGEHYVTPSPNIKHQQVVLNLAVALANFLERRPLGKLFIAPLDVVFTQFDVVEPDLLYMSSQRAATILTSKHVRGVPELVVEVGSPSTRKRDETKKRALYERVGVDEYWFADPERDVVRVYRREARLFSPPVELSRERRDVLRTPLLPTLRIALTRVFRE